MGWIANVSDGTTHEEKWIEGELSPWQRLMQHCAKNRCYVTNLRLNHRGSTWACKPNAEGYWAAHGVQMLQGLGEIRMQGIGHVENGLIYVYWGGDSGVIAETRSVVGQKQIIWARRPSLLLS